MAMHDLNCHHPQPMFTRRHYQKIAEVLKSERLKDLPENYYDMTHWERGAYDEWNTIRIALCLMFKTDNHLFDSDMFKSWLDD